MKFAAFLCFVFVTFKITDGTPPGGAPTFTCVAGATNDLTITYARGPNDAFIRMYVVGHENTCDTVIGDPASGDDIVVTVANLVAAGGTQVCGIDLAADVLTGDVVLHLTQSAANLLQSTDYKVTITAADCNFGNAVTATSSAVTISELLQAVAATVTTDTVTLSMVADASHGTDDTACQMGDTQRLKLSLATPSNSGATGLHPVTCTAKKDATATGSDTLELLTASCSLGVVGMTANTGFAPNDALPTDPTTAAVTVMQTTFDCFRFIGTPSTLIFECTVEFCTGALPGTRCAGDTCANVGAGRRRKRAATGNSTESVTTSVTIIVGESRPASSSTTHQECSGGFLHQTTFIVTVTILAVLLVLSMGATVYVAKKSRFVRSNPPPYLTKGADNPAF